MSAKWEELKVFRKTTKKYELQFKKEGIVEDITGWTIYFTVKEKMEDTDENAKISKKITSHSDPTNGKTLIELTVANLDLPLGNYYYSIDFLDDEGNAGILLHGWFKIEKPVRDTRD